MSQGYQRGNRRSKSNGTKPTGKPKKPSGGRVALVRLQRERQRPLYRPLSDVRPTPKPSGDPSEPKVDLLRLPSVLLLLSQWLKDRLKRFHRPPTLLLVAVFVLPLLVSACGTQPGLATKENPFLAIPETLLREPNVPVPLSRHLKMPSKTTLKTQGDGVRIDASSSR